MGTNYYAMENVCPHCNRGNKLEHIGKSSCGWTFSFHATYEIRSYKQWIEFLSKDGVKIQDEYGREISLEKFKELVENKKDAPHNHAKEVDSPYDKSFFLYIASRIFKSPISRFVNFTIVFSSIHI